MLIEFEERTHTYKIDGVIVPSVTQALRLGGFIDPTWFTEVSRVRGTAVHKACDLINRQDLDESSVHKSIVPYVKAYQRFLVESKFKLIASEKRVGSKKYSYGGTLDLYGKINNRRAIIDIKTGSVPDWVPYQLAAYMAAAREIGLRPQCYYSLMLKKNGEYRLRQHNGGLDFTRFLEALNSIKKRSA